MTQPEPTRVIRPLTFTATRESFWAQCRCGRVLQASGDPATVREVRRDAREHGCQYSVQDES